MKNLHRFYSAFTLLLVSIFINTIAYSLEMPEAAPATTPAWIQVNSP